MDHPVLRAVFETWSELRGDRTAPELDALDAVHFLKHSPNLLVCDVLKDGDVEFRIVGENIVAVRGPNLRGMTVGSFRDVFDDDPELKQFRTAVSLVIPQYYDGTCLTQRGARIRCRRVILPFTDENGACRKLLASVVYGESDLLSASGWTSSSP